MILIAISIDSDIMKGKKKCPPSKKNIKKDLAAESEITLTRQKQIN